MKSITIKEAIISVLKKEKNALTASEIYDKIIGNELYTFKSRMPVSIVSAQLRKSCEGVDLKKSSSTKMFHFIGNGKYKLIEKV